MSKVSDAAYELLTTNPEYEGRSVWYGDPGLLHAIADKVGMYENCKTKHGSHPLNIINKVLNGMEKDERFDKGYIRLQRLVRCFDLKEKK